MFTKKQMALGSKSLKKKTKQSKLLENVQNNWVGKKSLQTEDIATVCLDFKILNSFPWKI